jgi:hypothetical protein
VGVAVKRTLSASHPVVKVICDAKGKAATEFHKRLTSKPAHAVTGVLPMEQIATSLDCPKLWPATRISDSAE